jgi:hypothetical protein
MAKNAAHPKITSERRKGNSIHVSSIYGHIICARSEQPHTMDIVETKSINNSIRLS